MISKIMRSHTLFSFSLQPQLPLDERGLYEMMRCNLGPVVQFFSRCDKGSMLRSDRGDIFWRWGS